MSYRRLCTAFGLIVSAGALAGAIWGAATFPRHLEQAECALPE